MTKTQKIFIGIGLLMILAGLGQLTQMGIYGLLTILGGIFTILTVHIISKGDLKNNILGIIEIGFMLLIIIIGSIFINNFLGLIQENGLFLIPLTFLSFYYIKKRLSKIKIANIRNILISIILSFGSVMVLFVGIFYLGLINYSQESKLISVDMKNIMTSYDPKNNSYNLNSSILKTEEGKMVYDCLSQLSSLTSEANKEMQKYEENLHYYIDLFSNDETIDDYKKLILAGEIAQENLHYYKLDNQYIKNNYEGRVNEYCINKINGDNEILKPIIISLKNRVKKSNNITEVRGKYINAWDELINLHMDVFKKILNGEEISEELSKKEDILLNNANLYSEEYGAILVDIANNLYEN